MKKRTKIILVAIPPSIALVGVITVAVIDKWGPSSDEPIGNQPTTEIRVIDTEQKIDGEDCVATLVKTDKENVNVTVEGVDQEIECKKGSFGIVEQDSQAPSKKK